MPEYKWDNPYQWLCEYLGRLPIDSLYQEAVIIAGELIGTDTIQDLYQEEMDADGYFDDIAADQKALTPYEEVCAYLDDATEQYGTTFYDVVIDNGDSIVIRGWKPNALALDLIGMGARRGFSITFEILQDADEMPEPTAACE
jgi:hypothetical protein